MALLCPRSAFVWCSFVAGNYTQFTVLVKRDYSDTNQESKLSNLYFTIFNWLLK